MSSLLYLPLLLVAGELFLELPLSASSISICFTSELLIKTSSFGLFLSSPEAALNLSLKESTEFLASSP